MSSFGMPERHWKQLYAAFLGLGYLDFLPLPFDREFLDGEKPEKSEDLFAPEVNAIKSYLETKDAHGANEAAKHSVAIRDLPEHLREEKLVSHIGWRCALWDNALYTDPKLRDMLAQIPQIESPEKPSSLMWSLEELSGLVWDKLDCDDFELDTEWIPNSDQMKTMEAFKQYAFYDDPERKLKDLYDPEAFERMGKDSNMYPYRPSSKERRLRPSWETLVGLVWHLKVEFINSLRTDKKIVYQKRKEFPKFVSLGENDIRRLEEDDPQTHERIHKNKIVYLRVAERIWEAEKELGKRAFKDPAK